MAIKNLKFSKKTFFITSSFILLSALCAHIKKESDVKMRYETDEFFIGEYDDGIIVFGDQEFLDNYSDEGVIKILDERCDKDPNVKIYDSYKITNPFLRSNILKLLLDYEKEHDTPWDRTQFSMENEWLIHNLSYMANYKLDHSTDVDLNNADQKKYLLTK